MKKLIAALIVLGIVGFACVWEILFLKNTFDTAIEKLEKVDDAVSFDIENINNIQAMQAIDGLTTWWGERRMLAMGLLNHAQVKNIDDRLAMIQRQIEINAGADAAVTVRATMRMFEDLYYDSYPGFSNLF